LTRAGESFLKMVHEQIILRRRKLLDRLPVADEILRGSLLERTLRNHKTGVQNVRAAKATRSRF